jgi:hypothetical protein
VRYWNAAQQVIDIDCYEDEGAKEYGQQYDEVGHVVTSLLLFPKSIIGAAIIPCLNGIITLYNEKKMP